MTTTTTKPTRGKRAGVPAVDQATSSTSAVDALAAAPTTGLVEPIPLALLHPHPHNPRRDVGDITELADSIRAHGIRQNLLLVPDPDRPGEFRIVIGHRRAAGAAAAGLNVVPAVVDADLDEAGQLELMLLENLQRTDLTPVEEADGYQGLLDLGIGARTIAKRTGRSEKTITARLRLLKLPDDARQKVHTHQATLDDALALANFDGPDDLREDLAVKLGEPGFAHAVERARRAAEERRVVTGMLNALEVDGVTVVESLAGATYLSELAAAPKSEGRIPAALSPEEHKACPGHVAAIVTDYWGPPKAVYACTDWKANGHHKRYANAASTQTTEERREVVANNKAAAAAETVRRQWIRDFLKQSKMPADAAVYVARIVHPSGQPNYPESEITRTLLYGKPVTDRDVGDDRAKHPMRHLVALAAARVEASMPKDFWRADWNTHRIHLEQLAAWGYELADVEREYLAKAAKAKGRRSS